MTSRLIGNARLVNEGREFDGGLRFSDGRIEDIGSGLSVRDGETVIDAAGRRLLPGMIDDQVHFREPGNAAPGLVNEARLSTAQVAQKCAHASAQRFDVASRSNLREGCAADLALIDDSPYTERREDVQNRCGWSTFEGTTFHSRLASTWANGVLAWDGERVVGPPQGQRRQFDR